MKKTLKLFSLLFLAVFMSGCMKYEIGMEVGSDKSVVISIISAIGNDYASMSDTTESDTEAAEAKGFTVEDYEDDEYTGVKLSKKYDNIDSISTSDAVTVELTDILNEEKDDIEVYFQKKESLFKTTYIATFTIDMTSDEDDGTDYSSYSSMFDLTYYVTLPVEADSNDATSVSDDGLTYTWDLEYGEVNEINYSFTVSSFPTTIVIGGVVAIIVIVVLVLVLKGGKKNNVSNNNGVVNNIPMPNMDTNNSNNPVSMNNSFSNSSPIDAGSNMQPMENINNNEMTTNQQVNEASSIESNPIMNNDFVDTSSNVQSSNFTVSDPDVVGSDVNNVAPSIGNSSTSNMPSLENQPPIIPTDNNQNS